MYIRYAGEVGILLLRWEETTFIYKKEKKIFHDMLYAIFNIGWHYKYNA